MICEICGKNAEVREAIVENSIMKLCEPCMRFGKAIEIKPRVIEKKIIRLKVEEENEMVVPDYNERIKNARGRLNLKQDELAAQISEKSSLISALETGHIVPSLTLAKKLENALSIKLIDYYKLDHTASKLNLKDDSLTIGDLAKINKNESFNK